MDKAVKFFFRVTNRLFVIFITLLGNLWRHAKALDPANTKGRSLLVVRHGGFGDLMFLTPVLSALKQRYPGLTIDLMTHPRYQAAFYRHPAIHRMIDHRWPSAPKLFGYDYIAFLDGVVESDEDAETLNIYDLFATKYFNLHLTDNEKKPSVSLNLGHRQHLQKAIPGFDNPALKVGLQLKANSPVRTPDLTVWSRVLTIVGNQAPGCQIYIIAESNQSSEAEQLCTMVQAIPGLAFVCNTSPYTADVTDLIALVSLMDVVIAPDSSVAHIAAAFDIPTLGFYGPFPSILRTRYYRNTVSLDAPAPCAPCFTHGHGPCKQAKAQHRTNSPCFDNLTDDTITRGLTQVLDYVQQHPSDTIAYMRYRCSIPTAQSETGKFRAAILAVAEHITQRPLATLAGAEIGSGGDPLLIESVCVDLDLPYTCCGTAPIHFKGNGKKLPWFADASLDYVYSSHLFEDFDKSCNLAVLTDWLRVLKPGGLLILLLPHQQRYLAACEKRGEMSNEHHQIAEFSPDYMSQLIKQQGGAEIAHLDEYWRDDSNEYNFLAILRKSALPGGAVNHA